MNMNGKTHFSTGASDESFELLELLGSGGFAHTYKARVLDEDLTEDYKTDVVALKIPLNKKKERILRKEIEICIHIYVGLKKIKSPNLVQYLGFDVFRGQNVMVMEYAPGSLRDNIGKLGRQRPMEINTAVKIAKEILNGLAIIHQNNILHRDIKPENILGMESGTPKIADLGIARMLNSNELASTTTGTIFYMSPEILSEEGASFKSDVWSLGVTLYEMLTGMLPFGKHDMPIGRIVSVICNCRHIPAYEIRSETPRELSNIVDRSLARDTSERYDAKEMMEALTEFERAASNEIEKELTKLGKLIEDYGQTSVVEKKHQDLVRKFPKEPKAYLYLGAFYNKHQRYSEAKRAFISGLKLDPDNDLLSFDLGMVYYRLGNKRGSKDCFGKVIEHAQDISLRRKANMMLKTLGGK